MSGPASLQRHRSFPDQIAECGRLNRQVRSAASQMEFRTCDTSPTHAPSSFRRTTSLAVRSARRCTRKLSIAVDRRTREHAFLQTPPSLRLLRLPDRRSLWFAFAPEADALLYV